MSKATLKRLIFWTYMKSRSSTGWTFYVMPRRCQGLSSQSSLIQENPVASMKIHDPRAADSYYPRARHQASLLDSLVNSKADMASHQRQLSSMYLIITRIEVEAGAVIRMNERDLVVVMLGYPPTRPRQTTAAAATVPLVRPTGLNTRVVSLVPPNASHRRVQPESIEGVGRLAYVEKHQLPAEVHRRRRRGNPLLKLARYDFEDQLQRFQAYWIDL